MKVTIPIKRIRQEAVLPEYAHQGDAGMDVHNAGEAVTIAPAGRALIPTGLTVAIPEDHEIQVRPRSGLALKKGLTVLNTPGTIDAGYRGEIGVILFNTSAEPVEIPHGERIAQIVLNRHETICWNEVDLLPDSIRGEGGFGSTGTAKKERKETSSAV